MRRPGKPTGGRHAPGPPGGAPLTRSAHALAARFPSPSGSRVFPFLSRSPQAAAVIALLLGACVISDPRGLRRLVLCVRPSPHSPFPRRVSVRMRLALLVSPELRRGSRAPEETPAPLGRAFARSAAAAGRAETEISLALLPCTGYWKAGEAGPGQLRVRPNPGVLTLGQGGFGVHPGFEERGGEKEFLV